MRSLRRHRDAELADELRAHLDLLVEEKVRSGIPAAEALRLAHLEMGGLSQVAEAVRDTDRLAWLRRAAQDARYALRLLRRTPVFTATVAATLAIGIGTNTAIFTVVDAVLLRTLPVRDPQRLVAVGSPAAVNGHWTGSPLGNLLSLPLYRALRDNNNRLVTGLAATGTTGRLDVGIDGGSLEHPTGRFVSANTSTCSEWARRVAASSTPPMMIRVPLHQSR